MGNYLYHYIKDMNPWLVSVALTIGIIGGLFFLIPTLLTAASTILNIIALGILIGLIYVIEQGLKYFFNYNNNKSFKENINKPL